MSVLTPVVIAMGLVAAVKVGFVTHWLLRVRRYGLQLTEPAFAGDLEESPPSEGPPASAGNALGRSWVYGGRTDAGSHQLLSDGATHADQHAIVAIRIGVGWDLYRVNMPRAHVFAGRVTEDDAVQLDQLLTELLEQKVAASP